jgi:hypothetical protein
VGYYSREHSGILSSEGYDGGLITHISNADARGMNFVWPINFTGI